MRTFEWGRFPAQQADFHGRAIFGQSTYVDHGTLTRDAGSRAYDDGALAIDNGGGDVYRSLIQILLAKSRAALGHTPVIIAAELHLQSGTNVTFAAGGFNVGLYRLITQPDLPDVNQRYYDVSLTLPWGGDAAIYAPVPGVDHLAAPFSTALVTDAAPGEWLVFQIKDELAYLLAAAKDLWAMLAYTPIGTKPAVLDYSAAVPAWKNPTYYPYLRVRFMNPLEFFACKATVEIDLTKLLDNSTGLDINSLYVGSVEISQTGTPVPCRLKNLGTRILPHVEVWDDSPEWSTPAAGTGNAGSAALDHVVLADASLSQKYTVKFTSPTAFQVIGQAYKENTADLNPTYGTTGWTGAVGADFIAPSGGLTIPAAAWSGTAVANDTFAVYVTGNSTNVAWPADSNTQIQIAKDNGANAPDDTTWRPIRGQRTMLTSAVTIDATSKALSIRFIDTTLWPAGTKVIVADAANIDEGSVTAQTATSLTVTFPSATGHVYAAGAKVCSTLPIRNLGVALRAVTTGPAGASQSNPVYIPLTGALAAGFAGADVCSIQSVADPSLQEEFTIATGGVDATRILASALLQHDYTTGAMVLQGGSGEALFWLKIVANAVTLQERKQLRLAVRT